MKSQTNLILLSFFLLVFSPLAKAQKVEKFGKVSKEVLEMTTYEKDKDAEAVVLFDVGTTFMEYSQSKGQFTIRTEKHKRIKILKQEGVSQANIEVRYYVPENSARDESIGGLKAYTYNLEEGKIVESKMDKDAVFTEQEDENWKKRKFTLPNVKVGSVIEYKYTLSSDFIGDIDWRFQDIIPTMWSEYTVIHAEYYIYQPHFTGFEPLAINEKKSNGNMITFTSKERINTNQFGGGVVRSKIDTETLNYQDIVYHWAVQDAPAFKFERYITTPRDYLTKVDMELSARQFPNSPIKYFSSSWEDIAKTLFDVERFGGELTRRGDVKEVAIAKTAKLTDKVQKLAALYGVAREVKWNRQYSTYASKNIKQVLADKEGNSADINLLLLALCNAADIEAYPVVLSTRNHGKLRTYSPSLNMLNHVIVFADLGEGKELLLDASDKTTPLGILPYNCLNGTGILLKSKEKTEMITLSPSKSTKATCMATMNLTSEGIVTGELSYRFTDYAGVAMRDKYFDAKDEKEFIANNWEAEKNGFKINSFEAKDVQDANKPLSFKVNITTEDKTSGDMIYLEPFFDKVFAENPFTQENRKFPADFAYPAQESYIFSLQIPAEYQVEELPKSEKLVLPEGAGSFSLIASQQDNKIQIVCNFARSKTLFIGEEYPTLKEFIGRIIAKQSEQIVLKKKQ
jgi:hypothetical protein